MRRLNVAMMVMKWAISPDFVRIARIGGVHYHLRFEFGGTESAAECMCQSREQDSKMSYRCKIKTDISILHI